MRNWLSRTFVGVAIALSLPIAAASAADKLSISHSGKNNTYATILGADAMGYFQEENIDAEIIFISGGGAQGMAAVMSNNVQVYIGAPSEAMLAQAAGSNVQFIAGMVTEYTCNIVVSKAWADKFHITDKSTYEERLKALKGIRIAVTGVGSATEQLVRYLAKDAGLNADRDLTILPLGGDAETLAGFTQGRIDGFSRSCPLSCLVATKFGGVTLLNGTQGRIESLRGYLYTGGLVMESWAKAHSDLVVRFLKAQEKVLAAIADPAQTNIVRDKIYDKYYRSTDKDKPLYDAVWADSIPAYPKTVMFDAAAIQRVVDFTNTFAKKKIDAAMVAKSWTDEYAKKAVAAK
jgi:NitT/TauT family transport system substrate-binding protein